MSFWTPETKAMVFRTPKTIRTLILRKMPSRLVLSALSILKVSAKAPTQTWFHLKTCP